MAQPGLNWRPHFPYQTPRQIQAESLQALSDAWDSYDIFVLSAPTAFGKTAVAKCLMQAQHSVSVLSPTNLLVEQFRTEFPDTATLSRMDSYWCSKWERPAVITRNKTGGFCRRSEDCPGCHQLSSDLSTAKYRRGPGVYNYHTYLAHKLYRSVLVVDEAHNLIPIIRDRMSLVIWQHDYKYPHNMHSSQQMAEWIPTLRPNQQNHKKIQLLREAVCYPHPQYLVERTTELFNGKGTVRGEPEERDCLKLLPVDISTAPPMFWPSDVKKLVLMSATIGPKDIEALGLQKRHRVIYIDCQSPIAPERRPIFLDCSISVTRGRMEEAVPLLARKIELIAAEHPGEKGVIHATYQLARLLAPLLRGNDRYLFHDRDTKKLQYTAFRESRPDEGRILVASGMYEGIDLPEDLGRWQVIAKIPWQSLGNPAIRYMAEQDPDGFNWETIKIVIQACGRICRTPEDFGSTTILDSSFLRLQREGSYMFPTWWSDALVGVTK